MKYSTQSETVPRTPGRLSRYAWLPIPLLLALIAGLWVTDLRTVYESRGFMVLLNLFFTWLASLCICFLTARGFLASGQPGLLMFSCGSLMWGFTSLAAAVLVDRVNTTITVHNLGVFGAALCHLVGLLWHGRLTRLGQRLLVGYAGALISSTLIVWAAMEGVTPAFFVQGYGGTLVRQVVLLLAIAMFAWVAWQLIYKFRRPSGAFYYYYWYGLGLALVATGLIGVMLLSVQGGIQGWANRLTQYLGSAYLFVAAFLAARETGTWTFSLAAVDEAWRKGEFPPGFGQRSPLGWVRRYGLAVLAVAAAMGLRLALETWVGPGLPPFITFFPAVMVVALLAGFGPGLMATAFAVFVVGIWISPPIGIFSIKSPVDRMGLIIFSGMGLLMSAVAELYRRNREKAAAYDREGALRESERIKSELLEKMNEAQQIAMIGSWEWNLRTNRVWWSDETYRIFGVTPQNFVPSFESNGKFIHPDDFAQYGKAFEHSLQTGESLDFDIRLIVGEGLLKHCNAKGRVIYDNVRQPFRFVGTLMDITERKHAVDALRESEERYRSILENLQDGYIRANKEGIVIMASPSVAHMYGVDSNLEMVGLPAFSLYKKKEDRDRLLQELKKRHKVTDYESEALRKDGASFPVSLNAQFYYDSQGRIQGTEAFVRDITERKRAEENIVRLNENLNRQNRELAALNKELETFSFAVSHDLRAPLRHIDGFIRMLAEDYTEKLDETAKDYIRRVVAGAERMKNLIDALLTLSRFSHGGLNRSKVHLSTLGKSAAAELKKNQPERRVEFIFADDMAAMGDEILLQAVIDNLIGNAWKFTEKCSVARIEFGVMKLNEKNVYFVKDNGTGFDMELSEKMFMPFQRMHTESEFPGLGIGLSVVQRIVNRHGGRVWAEGEVGNGATFYFTLN
jgi:PAS domain S-box-containing protein